MSHYCWNLKHQQTQDQIEDESNRSSHMLNPSNPMSNHEVAEITKPTWGSSSDTLESIVHQATCPAQNFNLLQQHDPTPADVSSVPASSGRNRAESGGRLPTVLKKRTRWSSDRCGEIPSCAAGFQEDGSACASGSAAFCRDDDDTTMVSLASHESTRSMKAKTIAFAPHDGSEKRDEDRETKSEGGRSQSTRRTRASAVHNLSERRRRDRINQKMDALQKLVPNASKTDKASILDEVIEYLKQLQAQVEMMSMRSMAAAQMMMMQQQHQQRRQFQMSILARMGVGMGIGMPDVINSLARNPSPVIAPPFVSPSPVIPTPFAAAAQANSDHSSNSSIPLPDPYCAFLAQSMNMELYNKMAAQYRPLINQTTQTSSNPSRPNNVKQD